MTTPATDTLTVTLEAREQDIILRALHHLSSELLRGRNVLDAVEVNRIILRLGIEQSRLEGSKR